MHLNNAQMRKYSLNALHIFSVPNTVAWVNRHAESTAKILTPKPLLVTSSAAAHSPSHRPPDTAMHLPVIKQQTIIMASLILLVSLFFSTVHIGCQYDLIPAQCNFIAGTSMCSDPLYQEMCCCTCGKTGSSTGGMGLSQ